MMERRKTQRFRVLKGGTVAFAGNNVACTVRNLSTDGAALDFAGHVNVPSSFTLAIKSNQLVRRCRPVWSREKQIGVAFE